MQQLVLIIIIAVFLVAVIRQSLYWTWLWQLKEYRWDKVRAHFQDIGFARTILALAGYSSLRQLKIPKFTVKAAMISLLSFLSAIAALILIFQNYLTRIFLAVSFLNRSYFSNLNLSKNSINMPAAKSLLLSIAHILGDYEIIIGIMAAVFLIMPLVVLLVVDILNIISAVFKKITIARAKEKMLEFPNLKVIGITGSYGKSTTKEILYEILSKSRKYSASGESALGGKVLKTPANINTPIGIAQLILDKLDKTHEIFIVEMGAYKIGEIKDICKIVKPKVGIITSINEQHLALFGRIENTIKAKFELMDSLPESGVAILNVGDANIQVGLENEKCVSSKDVCNIKAKRILYSVGAKSDVYAIKVANNFQNIKFTFISGADTKDFTLNIAGAHNASNALAAIIAAREFGMGLDEISQAIQKMNRFDFTLKTLAGPNGSTLIDDTYNANPDGVLAAFEHIEHQMGRKFIIMSSLVEMGSAAHKVHNKLGNKAALFARKLFFLDSYYIDDIKKGSAENKDSIVEIKVERDAQKIVQILNDELKSSDTVLFINRGARKVLELLKR